MVKMAPKVISTNQIERINQILKPNKILSLLSITLLTIMGVFAGKLVMLMFFSNISPWGNDIIIIISCCLTINIAAYLILYRYQLLLSYVANCVEVKTASLNHINNNLRLEIEERKKAKYFLENVLDNSADPIGIVDQHGIFIKWNKAAEDTFGYNVNELRDKSFSVLYADEKELDIMLSQLRQECFVRSYEINMKKRDGSVAPFATSISILRDKHKKVIGSVCIARYRSDICEEKTKLKTLNEQPPQEPNGHKQVEVKQPKLAAIV